MASAAPDQAGAWLANALFVKHTEGTGGLEDVFVAQLQESHTSRMMKGTGNPLHCTYWCLSVITHAHCHTIIWLLQLGLWLCLDYEAEVLSHSDLLRKGRASLAA